MALAPCRECGAQVSTEAATCPQCGVPHPTQPLTVPGAPAPSAGREGALAGQTALRENVPSGALAEPQRMTAQETPVYQAHVHWVIYSKAILVALLAVATFIATQYAAIAPYAAIALLAVAIVLAVISNVQARSTEFVITTRRLIAKRGVTSRRTIETLLEKVEAVTVEQGLWGRMLGYGQVTVIGTGGTNETFSLVADPMHLRQVIHEQIDSARR